jgi:diguanylate cyclase (GGDEF)-like protein
LTGQFQQSQQQAQDLQAKQLRALLDDRYQQMSRLANVVPLLIPPRAEETLEQHLRRALNTNGVMLDLEWDIRSVHWIRPDGRIQLLWPSEAPALPVELAARAERAPDQTARMLSCVDDCRQLLAAPLLWNGESSGALVLGRSVADALLAFNALTGAEVAMVPSANVPESTTDPTHFKAITHATSTRTLFEQALSNEARATTSRGVRVAESTDDELPVIVLVGNDRNSYEVFRLIDLVPGIDALVLNNVTAQREAIGAATRLSFLIGVIGLMLSEVLMLLIMSTSLSRLRRLADLLPLLADQRFSELKERLPSPRLKLPLRDEMDLMVETVRKLSDRMYAMEQDREQTRRELVWLADHDPLTKLLNRRRFDRELKRSVEDATQSLGSGALMFVDLDQFKDVNDISGHQMGDGLLREIANRLTEGTDDPTVLGRLGGDEFAIILPNATNEQAIQMATEVQRRIQQVVVHDHGWRHQVSASIGIVLFPMHGRDAQQLMADADLAMYQAKEKGRGRWHLFSPDDTGRERANARVIWAQRIVDALRDDRFELHFQPILEIATGKIWRAEALIRMRDTDGRLVLPGSFIPIAEETHQIRTLDQWVLAHAIELMRHHLELSLSVNLSANAVQDPSLPLEIERLLSTNKVPPTKLTLEVTETVAINSLAQASRLMHEIRAIGCHFALDDFGSGFASYAYLRQLPVDDVKIDGAFIRDIAYSKEDRIFVRAVTEMAHGMGKKVIAEFVENAAIVEVLAEIGVDYAQGYHIGRPEPPQLDPHRLKIADRVAV